MIFRTFVDTNVFIYAFEFPESNSAKIIELLNRGKIEAVISERVVKEVTRYFEKFYNVKLARDFRKYLLASCIVVMNYEVAGVMDEIKGEIKDKDLEQLAVVRKYGLKYLIAYDKDFKNCEEYLTPKRFLKMLKEKVGEEEF